jgi:hypothetical protein
VRILSKCVAGGLSAGLVLLWWSRLFPAASLSAWLGRGVAFTLSFELLLLGLRPLEHALRATRLGGRSRAHLDALAARLRRDDAARRLGPATAVAAVALAVPILLIAAGLNEPPARDAAYRARPVEVVRVTKVVRRVRRVVAPSEAPATSPVTTSRPVAAAPEPDQRSNARTRTSKPRRVTAPAREPSHRQEAKAPASEPAAPQEDSCAPNACPQADSALPAG